MNKKHRAILYRVILSCVLLGITYAVPLPQYFRVVLFIVNYLIIGYDVLIKSFRNILNGQVFDENFLMSIATVGAIAIGEFGEAVFVMVFYQIGELFQSIAVGKSRKSISDLMDICPEYANIEKDGKLEQIDPSELRIGDVIVIKPGEKIPVDGVVISGSSSVNTSNLTGESRPSCVSENDSVISGCINLDGVLYVRVEKEFSDSTVCRILELVEEASSAKTVTENFITKFAKYYTPAVVGCAAALAIVAPLFAGNPALWLHRALIFLVISCPCALVISVPMSFFGGIGCASKNGILIKGSNFIEALAKCSTAAFDKTGTLTKGIFAVSDIIAEGISRDELLKTVAYAEFYSNHPIAISIKKRYNREIDEEVISDVSEIAGKGVSVKIGSNTVLAGNKKLMYESKINVPEVSDACTVVYAAINGVYRGYIVISDEIKPGSRRALEKLRECGAEKLVMLTGDKREIGELTAEKLGIDVVYSELMPSDKIERLEELLKEQKKGKTLAYAGDGVNDAPVLTRADVGIAMGAMGSDAAIEAADVVLMDDNIAKIPLAVKISVKTIRIVKQNIIFAISVKLLVMILGAYGIANMWEAVFADVGVSVIAILNAMRTLGYKENE